MAGAASSALFKKVKRMKSSNQNGHQAKLEIPVSPNAGIQSHGLRSFMERRDSVSEICEETGFVRLVYRQARSLKDKRVLPYRNFKDVASDVRHAVRVCLLVCRFLEFAKAGQAKNAYPDANPCLLTSGVIVDCNLQQADEDDANRSWLALMKDLSPMTPALTFGMPSSPYKKLDKTPKLRSCKEEMVEEHVEEDAPGRSSKAVQGRRSRKRH